MSNTRALPNLVTQATRSAGVELPAAIREADEKHARALAVLDTPRPDNFMPAALDALHRGKHPADDTTATAAFLDAYLRSINFDTQAREALARERADAYLKAYPDCLDTWRPVFDQLADRIAHAAEVLGQLFTSNAPADRVLKSGAAAAAAWLDAAEAEAQMNHIVDAINALVFALNNDNPLRDPAALIVEHDVDKWLANKPARNDRVLDIARRGHRLDLHTLDEAREFIAAVTLEEDRRDEAAALERKQRGPFAAMHM